MEKFKTIMTKVLLSFVLITIGYALGRESAIRHFNATLNTDNQSIQKDDTTRLIVYYTHGMIRCSSCNSIEKTAESILHKDFQQELDSGVITWKVVNFQENEEFAKQFDVTASGLILALMKDGKVVKVEKLEKVWTLINSPVKFHEYIKNAITKNLAELQKDL